VGRILEPIRVMLRSLLAATALLALITGCSGEQNTATAAAPAAQPLAPHVETYSTKFLNTENPISEGGRWIGGKTVGLD